MYLQENNKAAAAAAALQEKQVMSKYQRKNWINDNIWEECETGNRKWSIKKPVQMKQSVVTSLELSQVDVCLATPIR